MEASILGLMQPAEPRKVMFHLCSVILIFICVGGLARAEDSWAKQTAIASFNSFCSFNPVDNLTYVKIITAESELVNRSAGNTIKMFCADNVLRKEASGSVSEYDITCRPVIEIDELNRQILRYYWDLTVLNDQCGHPPVCPLSSGTYNHPVLDSSSNQLLHEETIAVNVSGNHTRDTMVGYYMVGTTQTYSTSGVNPCANLSLTVQGDTSSSTCLAPTDLAILSDDADVNEIRTNYQLLNSGNWEFEPPQCVPKKCPALDLEGLGFSADDIVTPQLEEYLVGDSVQIQCADGQVQLNPNVTSETINCVVNGTGTQFWERAENSLRITHCSVKQCTMPTAASLQLSNGTVAFSSNNSVYNLGETIEMFCANGYVQRTIVVESETLTCRVQIDSGVESYVWEREEIGADRLGECVAILCPLPANLTFEYVQRDANGTVSPTSGPLDASPLRSLIQITCEDLGISYVSECQQQEVKSIDGMWVPATHCRQKNCTHFMADKLLFEYELQYGRHIVGEPRTIEFLSFLTFICPPGTVAFGRNELSYQCIIGSDGFGHFEAVEPDVTPDCRAITCPRNDSSTGTIYDITYPYYERECDEDMQCRIGMIVSLNCSATEEGFTPLFQCDAPASAAELVTDENNLTAALSKGVWFPTPSCTRGCLPPENVTHNLRCAANRLYNRGEWNFPDNFVVECTCERGYIRDDGSMPEVQCDGSSGEWTVTKPCHVDCNPIPDVPHAIQDVTYYDTYALMNIRCEAGYDFFPPRDVNITPAVAECHLGAKEWLNLHLYECKAPDGCTESAVQDYFPNIHLLPDKDYYNDGETVLAMCTEGYLEGDQLYQVLVCNALYEEVKIADKVVLLDTDRGPAPSDFSGFHHMPNVTMNVTGFEWDYQYVEPSLTCITNYTEHYPEWSVVKDN